MNYHIKQPKTDEEFQRYYYLRWKLLRAPWKQPRGSEFDDLEDRSFHFMAVDKNEEIIAVARLQSNSSSEAQIRYMAVETRYERRGIGRQLINAIEQHAADNGLSHIVLDARESAVSFYKNSGYKVVKKTYLLFDEIQHYHMKKIITHD